VQIYQLLAKVKPQSGAFAKSGNITVALLERHQSPVDISFRHTDPRINYGNVNRAVVIFGRYSYLPVGRRKFNGVRKQVVENLGDRARITAQLWQARFNIGRKMKISGVRQRRNHFHGIFDNQ